ncbi:MAG: putative 2-aminoethylphosphonate ABC transporter permease subunit [Caldilinea sp.]|nr:putative 2-aminoethylphosphonate ABC transporter permease subunit [Caldilinea sp.]MDW8441205.1 putative 2-aminoethylphosphonate ABC transporter permease subunit [Caldilineaceae bacterium]
MTMRTAEERTLLLPHGRVRPVVTAEEWLRRLLLLLVVGFLLVGVLLPLVPLVARSLSDPEGRFVGPENYVRYFSSPGLVSSFVNSLTIATATTLLAVGLAFGYAWAIARTCMPGKGLFRAIALLPLFAPPLALAIGLVYLFGNKGLVTTGFFGFFERTLGLPLAYNIHLYGINGIILGELLYCFPQAFLILMVAASLADARLYEASMALKASPLRTFWVVTLPGMRYGLISAIFVCFTLAFTDFGVPKVVGGNFNVLATDIYKQVIGQQNFVMGATISILLLAPTGIAFVIDRIAQRRQMAVLTSRSVPLRPRPHRLIDTIALVYCSLIAAAILIVIGAVVYASFVDVWPYRLGLTLRHYDFRHVGGGGWAAYTNSLWMSFYSAFFGVTIVFLGAYIIEKSRTWPPLRHFAYFLSMISVALPGLVIGIAYIFFFNPKSWTIAGFAIPNPFAFLYGTMAILVLANIVHFYTVSFMTATTALKQIDSEFESVSASMRVPFYRTFARITLPLSLPAVAEIAMYLFVNSMVTVSAVIFLYSPQLRLASVAIVHMDEAGDTAAAAAMSVLIIAACLIARLVYTVVVHQLNRRTQAWRLP